MQDKDNAFEPGEIVDIAIKGARVTNVYPRTDLDGLTVPILVADYTDGVERSVAVSLGAQSVTVERVAPAEWPPQPGDLWRDNGDEIWFSLQLAPGDVALVPSYPVQSSKRGVTPDRVMKTVGPLTLVHREDAS